jgi:hypothetical protein
MNLKLYRTAMLTGVFASALALSACGADNAGRDPNAPATKAPAADTTSATGAYAQMTLNGCLQKEDGILGDYILTQANAPADAVGTSGQVGTVEGRQLEAAARSYRLSGESDKLRNLVGHQVRVMGTLKEASSVSDRAASGDRPAEIKDSHLAKVEVMSVEDIAGSCASSERPTRPTAY